MGKLVAEIPKKSVDMLNCNQRYFQPKSQDETLLGNVANIDLINLASHTTDRPTT